MEMGEDHMQAILISINKPYTDYINNGTKTSELRTRPPKINTPFRVYTYETINGGGSGKIVNTWICRNMYEWLMYMGMPAHLPKVACVSNQYICEYSRHGERNITEMKISDLHVYEKPIPLSSFSYRGKSIQRAPQNWCYVDPIL